MTEDHDQWADKLTAEHSGGWLSGIFAEEDRLDRRGRLRLASWGVGAAGAVTLAVLASQFSGQLRRDLAASTDLLTRQAQQIQSVARESQTDSRRLAAAIDTLNSDRDRLFSRVTSVEQGLESVTGAIKRQTTTVSATSATNPAPTAQLPTAPAPGAVTAPTEAQGQPAATSPPSIGPVSTVSPNQVAPAKPGAIVAPTKPAPSSPNLAISPEPATPSAISSSLMPVPLMPDKSMWAPPDSAATPLSGPSPAGKPEPSENAAPQMASVQPADAPASAPELPAVPVQRTEFGVDLGTANTIEGLRGLWRSIVATNKLLSGLRPVIVLRERSNGYGMQLRLVAGPLSDAAAAARLCASLGTADRSCETSVFEGQRLTMKAETASRNDSTAAPVPSPARPLPPPRRKRSVAPVEQRSEAPPAKPEEPAPKPQSSLTTFLGMR